MLSGCSISCICENNNFNNYGLAHTENSQRKREKTFIKLQHCKTIRIKLHCIECGLVIYQKYFIKSNLTGKSLIYNTSRVSIDNISQILIHLWIG